MGRFISGPKGHYNSAHIISVWGGVNKFHAKLINGESVEIYESSYDAIARGGVVVPGSGVVRTVYVGVSNGEVDIWWYESTIIAWEIDLETEYHLPIAIDQPPRSGGEIVVIKDGVRWVDPGDNTYFTWSDVIREAEKQGERLLAKKAAG